MGAYTIRRECDILTVGFCGAANNDEIVKDATARLEEMCANGDLGGGGLIKVNGPASVPVAMVLAHELAHLFGAVACFDPKMDKYVVAISHSPDFAIGDWIA